MKQASDVSEQDPTDIERQRHDLPWVFAFLSLTHVAAFYAAIPMSERSGDALPVWIAYGGIGTIAVWFAWTCRSVFERLVRVGIVFCLFCVTVTNVIPSYMHRKVLYDRASIQTALKGRRIAVQAARTNGNVRSQARTEAQIKNLEQRLLTLGDTIYEILACWLCGALLIAYLATWFTGYRLVPPGEKLSKSPLSIQSILVLTFVAALAFYFVRLRNPANRMIYFANGATVGALAIVAVWSTFQTKVWMRILAPLFAIATVVYLDIVVGGSLATWRGTIIDRAEYLVRFAGGLVVSPILTAMVLRKSGYRLAR